MQSLVISTFLIFATSLSSCQSGFTLTGNEGGSVPVNDQEGYELQKAVNRCHRTGGTRVVKVKGELKCY